MEVKSESCEEEKRNRPSGCGAPEAAGNPHDKGLPFWRKQFLSRFRQVETEGMKQKPRLWGKRRASKHFLRLAWEAGGWNGGVLVGERQQVGTWPG